MANRLKERFINWRVYRRTEDYLRNKHLRGHELSFYELIVFFGEKLKRDEVAQRAGSVAFQFTLSVFPAILFLFSLLPYIPIPDLNMQIMDFLSDVLPRGLYKDSISTIYEIISQPRGDILSFGFGFTIFASTSGMVALMNAFNKCHKYKEKRSFLKKRLIALGLTFMLGLVLVLAIGLIIIAEVVLNQVELLIHIESFIDLNLLVWLRYLSSFLVFFLAISTIYYIAPSGHKRWRFLSAGSVFASLLSIIITKLFSYYISHFAQYNKLYGSIGTLICFMLWLYLLSLILLLGFEINAGLDESQRSKAVKPIVPN